MKLRPKQIEALEWLLQEPWTAAWWGGRPHAGWPKQMPVQTYNSLSLAKLITTFAGQRFDRVVMISDAGKEALENSNR